MTKVLFVTVGGSPQPIVTSITSLKPDRVIFICSETSITQVTGNNKPCELRDKGGTVIERLPNIPSQLNLEKNFNPETDIIKVKNPDDLSGFYVEICAKIREIRDQISDAILLADYTGGTKTMSVALSIAAFDYQLQIYLTTSSRTDLIRVQRGETVRRSEITCITLERLLTQNIPPLLHQYNYSAAMTELKLFLQDNMLRDTELIDNYHNLFQGLNYWDCFDHAKAWFYLQGFINKNELRDLLLFLKRVMGSRQLIDKNFEAPSKINGHGYELVEDLLFNAERRANLERFDDAVGRIYRALELLAQIRLYKTYEIRTDNLDLEKLPETLRSNYKNLKNSNNGKIELALHNSYKLLVSRIFRAGPKSKNRALLHKDFRKPKSVVRINKDTNYKLLSQLPNDPLGVIYTEYAELLFDKLKIRNYSLLAHGFRPVTEIDYQQDFQEIIKFIKVGLQASIENSSALLPIQFPNEIIGTVF